MSEKEHKRELQEKNATNKIAAKGNYDAQRLLDYRLSEKDRLALFSSEGRFQRHSVDSLE
jgi:hypothetical protein